MGQTLRFYARRGKLVKAQPGRPVQEGVRAQYAGRVWSDEHHGYIATDRELVCDWDSETGREIVRLFKQTPKDPPLWPANEATAEMVGQPFVPLEFQDGEWAPAPAPKPKPAASSRMKE